MKHLLFFSLLLGMISCASNELANSAQSKIEQIISQVDSTANFNGVVGLLRKNESPVLVYHGFKSPMDQQERLDSTDYFHIASNSKLFAGLAALKMMADFGLNLNDSIAPYFPELHPNLGKVNIQQLANHTCAIHDYFSLADKAVGISNEEAMQLIARLDTTVYEPGLRWGYTNSGYLLLSLLIERVTQIAYNDYLTREILLPMGIDKAQLHPNKIQSLKGFENGKPSEIMSITTGDAGMYFTAQDWIHFFEYQQSLDQYIEKAKKWSSPWNDENWRYGFGWFFSKDSSGSFRAHSGKSGGFESYIRIYDSNERMIFILSNNTNGSAKLLRQKLIDALNNGLFQK